MNPPPLASTGQPQRHASAPRFAQGAASQTAPGRRSGRRSRLPGLVHPLAWWAWALGLASAATRTTNPLLLLLLIAVAGYVVICRRTDAPWAKAFRLYLVLGAVIVALRVAFRIVLGGDDGTTVLLRLPSIPLPPWAAGIRLLGDVTAESLLGGLYDGLRLATMVICVGAANALANPKRLLRSVPTALYDIGTSVVVAVSVFPQLADSVQRVRRARHLRGGAGRRGAGATAIRAVAVPVLADALDRSLLLAAAMDSRGYGRHGRSTAADRRLTGALSIAGLLGVCIGVYGTLDGSAPRYLAYPALMLGLGIAGAGFLLAALRARTTRYRPDRWDLSATLTAACGIAAAALLLLAARQQPEALNPPLQPLRWPVLSTLPLLAGAVGVLPAWLTPPPLLGAR